MQLADPTLTPGESSPTPVIRHVTLAVKRQVYKAYGVSLIKRLLYVIDHLIPLELNGTNSVKNLWPQTRLSAKLKDKDENRLAHLVTTGVYALSDAQAEMLSLWRAQDPINP